MKARIKATGKSMNNDYLSPKINLAALAQIVTIPNVLLIRLQDNDINTFEELMTANRRFVMRCRGIGKNTLADFDRLRETLTDTWNRCKLKEAEEQKYGNLWEQRTWDAAVAIIGNHPHIDIEEAVSIAEYFVEEYKNREGGQNK